MWWNFRWQSFCLFSSGEIGLVFVTENFATLFTARKETCHPELTLGASSPNNHHFFSRSTAVRFHFVVVPSVPLSPEGRGIVSVLPPYSENSRRLWLFLGSVWEF